MARKRFGDMNCAIAQALEAIGDWWTFLIIRDAFLGVRRFTDFQGNLGIAKNILSQRLNHLLEHNILEKVEVNQRGSRYEYQLTDQGKDLYTTITVLRQWSDRWIMGEGNEPIIIKDSRTNKSIPRVKVLDAEGQLLKPQYVSVEPGPGADAGTLELFKHLEIMAQ